MIGYEGYLQVQHVDAIRKARNISSISNGYTVNETYQAKDLIENFAKKNSVVLKRGLSGYEFVVENESQKHSIEQKNHVVVSVKDMVSHARKTFGLNVVQVASLTGVSRATLYNHLHEKEQPSSVDIYQKLYNTSKEVRKGVRIDIKPGLKSIIVDGHTLLGHLKKSYSDTKRIVDICKEVEQKLLEMNPDKQSVSVEQQRQVSHSHSKMG